MNAHGSIYSNSQNKGNNLNVINIKLNILIIIYAFGEPYAYENESTSHLCQL